MSFSSSAHFSSVASYPVAPTEVQDVINVEKLSLSHATAVGAQVSVSDGFYSTPSGGESAFFAPFAGRGGLTSTLNERPVWGQVTGENIGSVFYAYTGTAWANIDAAGDDSGYENPDSAANGNEDYPWLANWSGSNGNYVLANPALQQLTSADTSPGAVFVPTLGIFTPRGDHGGGKQDFTLLGLEWPSGPGPNTFIWNGDEARWELYDGDGNLQIYSLSDVATPDLASNWKNASDDSDASITVTSVTAGDLTAGFKIGSDTFVASGSNNGRNAYKDVLGVAGEIDWTGSVWHSPDLDDVNLGNVAFPWLGTPEVTVTKSNVAAEENWIEATSIPLLFPAIAHF